MFESERLILGGKYIDERGSISFVNDFDMTFVKRFYIIHHPNIDVVRAWQGHKLEHKWFYCLGGSFLINVIKIDDWENPSLDLLVVPYHLSKGNPNVLSVKGGHVTGIKALQPDSSLMVFSNMHIDKSKSDDFRFDKNRWFNWNL